MEGSKGLAGVVFLGGSYGMSAVVGVTGVVGWFNKWKLCGLGTLRTRTLRGPYVLSIWKRVPCMS